MRWLACLLAVPVLGLSSQVATAQDEDGQSFAFGVLRQIQEPPAWETAFTRPPEDDGLAGARLGIQDNMSTGQFMGQDFTLEEEVVQYDEEVMPAFERLVETGATYILLDVPADDMLAIADAADPGIVLFNVGAKDDRLRNEDCRANVFHAAPSRSMETDALAQYLMTKRWGNWLLIAGRGPGDDEYAEALRNSATKFGATIVEEREWDFGPDVRRQAQAEVPVFTQNVSYDIAVIADEQGEFGDLILYRTWDPRPTAGTAGLTASAWHPAVEAWGAVQLQNRFIRLAERRMGALDYQYWIAVRSVGEAATQVQDDDVEVMRERLASPELEIGGHKSVALSYRPWDQQLRQPIPVAHPAALVSLSPQEGFLHQRTPLDTMGTDEPETQCSF